MSRMDLNYNQRRALRRISRGQSINKSMAHDGTISQCYVWSTPAPEKPVSEMDIVEYCDYEARLRSGHPVLTPYGKALLAEIGETPTSEERYAE